MLLIGQWAPIGAPLEGQKELAPKLGPLRTLGLDPKIRGTIQEDPNKESAGLYRVILKTADLVPCAIKMALCGHLWVALPGLELDPKNPLLRICPKISGWF